MNKIKETIQQHEKEMIAFRRELHQYPELSKQEFETTNRIARELDKLSIPYKRMEPTGLVAEIKGSQPGKTLLLRADIDALPVTELNQDLEYKSLTTGHMHACGHDAHTAMLLTAAKTLTQFKEDIRGTVRLIFQPSEENAEGAGMMIEQGVMEGVDNVFGMHIWSGLESGKVSCPAGPTFAASDTVVIHFQGQGGHAAMPHQTIDAAVMASQFVSNIQAIVAREVDPLHPAVVTIGTMNVGDRFNVIAEHAYLEGTVRTFDEVARDKTEEAVQRYAQKVAEMYGGTVSVEYIRKSEPVVNEERSAQLARDVATQSFGEDVLKEEPPTMGAEDFGAYLAKANGTFALVGSANHEKDTCWAHHHGRFNVDEEAMKVGAELHVQYALAYLNQDNF